MGITNSSWSESSAKQFEAFEGLKICFCRSQNRLQNSRNFFPLARSQRRKTPKASEAWMLAREAREHHTPRFALAPDLAFKDRKTARISMTNAKNTTVLQSISKLGGNLESGLFGHLLARSPVYCLRSF